MRLKKFLFKKKICLTLLKYRRSKKYGIKDGNPLSFEDFKELITDLKETENKGVRKILLIINSDSFILCTQKFKY